MNPLIIESKPPLILRVIGVAVLAGGIHFLRKYFFTDLIASIRDPDFFPVGLLGLLFILAVGLGFVAGGMVMTFMSRRTVIDVPAGTVRSERLLLGLGKVESWRIADFTQVLKLWHSEKGDSSTTTIHAISLLHRDGHQVDVDLFTREKPADELAQQLATQLHLPIKEAHRDEWLGHVDRSEGDEQD